VAVLRGVVDGLFAVAARRRVIGAEHIPPTGPCLLVFNHLSNFDPPLLFTVVRRPDLSALLAADYRERPVHRALIEAAGGMWIRRGASDRAALTSALALLERGWIVGIAPEGRRSPTGGLIEGKRGPAFLATRANVPVLPIGVVGTDELGRRLRRLRRTKLTVRIGAPFTLPPLAPGNHKQQLEACTDQIMCRIAALLPERLRGVYADHPRLRELPTVFTGSG
jgi:1-acyl-sn-glycerol-3-phosphate acyltransferase